MESDASHGRNLADITDGHFIQISKNYILDVILNYFFFSILEKFR